MTITKSELQAIAQLAYLETNPQDIEALSCEINAILDFVKKLRETDPKGLAPLFHPSDMHQRFREDEVTEESCLAELESIAPLFEEQTYLVPKVIDLDK